PPSSCAAMSAPCFAASKYGLLICFGMNVTDVPPPAAALAGAEAGAADAEAGAADVAAAVGAATDAGAADGDEAVVPHAANTIAAAPSRAAIRPDRCAIKALPPLVMDRLPHQGRPTRPVYAGLPELGRTPL